jgi:hypothetical protein
VQNALAYIDSIYATVSSASKDPAINKARYHFSLSAIATGRLTGFFLTYIIKQSVPGIGLT